MTALAFDTLRLAKRLRDGAGFSPEHAEAFAEALTEAVGASDLATRTDLAAVKTELKGDIAAVKADVATVRLEIELSKRDLKIWLVTAMGGLLTVAISIIIAAIRYIPHTP